MNMSGETFQEKLKQTELDTDTIFPVSLEAHVNKNWYQDVPDRDYSKNNNIYILPKRETRTLIKRNRSVNRVNICKERRKHKLLWEYPIIPNPKGR